MRLWNGVFALGVLALNVGTPELKAQKPLEAIDVATALSELGPRNSYRKPAHQSAQATLLAFMRSAGLEGVGQLPVSSPEVFNLTGNLPGSSGLQIILSAHYDSVKGSPGAIDDASGCGVVLAAASALSRLPRRHELKVILFDYEEEGARGSRLWLEKTGHRRRRDILADINVDMVGWSAGSPVILAFPTVRSDRLEQAPGWLVHAAVQGASAVGTTLRMFDDRLPFVMQAVARVQRFRYGADSDSFLRYQVPSLTLSDSPLLDFDPLHHTSKDTSSRLDRARLAEWSGVMTSTVLRLDRLEGRPVADDQYLVALGRVWPRKYLYWAGFLIWIALVFKGVPGRWVSTSKSERVQKGNRYMPGFVFRVLFLVSFFSTPVLATVLLYPSGIAYACIGRRGQRRKTALIVGFAPLTVFIGVLALARFRGLTQGWPVPWWPVLLTTLTLAAFIMAIARISAVAEFIDSSELDPSSEEPTRATFEIGTNPEISDTLEPPTVPSSQPGASPRKR